MPNGGQRRLWLWAALVLAALMTSVAVASAASGQRVSAADADGTRETGRLVALFDPPPPGARERSAAVDAVREEIATVLDRTDLQAVRRLPELGALAVRPDPGQSLEEARRELLSQPDVIGVERERLAELRFTPNDPAFNSTDIDAPGDDKYQWNLRREHFRGAWNHTKGGDARIAVIDTGIDDTHPDLGPRIASAIDNDPGGGAATNDNNGHGTHVSGLACAQGHNGFGIVGGAYKCQLIVVRTDLSSSSIAESINEAVNANADVISMSFGGSGAPPSDVQNAINRAWSHGVVMVAAADNNNGGCIQNQGWPAQALQSPGSGSNIDSGKGLVVTSAEYDNTPATSSCTGTNISLAAYGDSSASNRGIFSSFPINSTDQDGLFGTCSCRKTFQGQARYAYLFGTSMATPQVAAAAGLIRSRLPSLSAKSVIRRLKKHASRSGGYSTGLGWGILHANRALAL